MMDWLTRRSRRKGAVGGRADLTAAVVVGGGQTSLPSTGHDKENLVDGTAAAGCHRFRSRRKLSQGGSSNASSHNSESSLSRTDGGGGKDSIDSTSSSSCICGVITDEQYEKLVDLPGARVDQREWIAFNSLAFFHHTNVLYGSIAEFCTVDACSVMCGPNSVQYPWVDDRGKKCKYSAPQYVDCVMSNVEKLTRSEELFPTKFGRDFPANFDVTVKKIFRVLCNVLSHMYASHFKQLYTVNVGAQGAALTKHFYAFSKRYHSLDAKDLSGLAEILEEWNAWIALQNSSEAYRLSCQEPMDVAQLTLMDNVDCCSGQQQQQFGFGSTPPNQKLSNLQVSNRNIMNLILDDDD